MFIYLLILVVYLCLTVYTSLKINSSSILSVQQKRINIFLNALVPGIWFYLIAPIIFPKNRIITRHEREKMIAKETGSKLEDGNSSWDNVRHL